MFIINGEPLHKKTHPQEFGWMQEKIKKIKSKDKKNWTYSAFHRRAKIMREDGRLIPQKERRRIVSVVGSTTDAVGIYQTWAYASDMGALKSNDAGGYALKRPTMALSFDTIFSIDQDIELIFFFEYLSNNKKVKRIDHEAIARENAEKTALRSKAESLVYSDDSPLHPSQSGTDELLKNMALAWGVTNAITLDVYSVMNELWGRVQASNTNYRITKRGFKEFIDDVSKYGSVDKRAIITQAIEKGILIYDASLWKMNTDGGVEQFLCGVPFPEENRKTEYIMDYVLSHDSVYEAVKLLVEKPVENVKYFKKKIDPEKGPSRFDLLKEAQKELGWSGQHYKTISKMNKEQLTDLVESKRRPE